MSKHRRNPTIGETFGKVLNTIGGMASLADEAVQGGTAGMRTFHGRMTLFEETERLKGIAKHHRLRQDLIDDCDNDPALAAALGIELPPAPESEDVPGSD